MLLLLYTTDTGVFRQNTPEAFPQGNLGLISHDTPGQAQIRPQPRYAPAVTGAEIVQDQDFVVLGDEGIGKSASQEVGATCDEYSHAASGLPQ